MLSIKKLGDIDYCLKIERVWQVIRNDLISAMMYFTQWLLLTQNHIKCSEFYTLLDIPLSDVTHTWREGLLMKKACISARTSNGEQTYKFGVFNVGGWVDDIQDAIDDQQS